MKVRHDINIKFYGKEYTVQELMDGTVPPPPAAKPLYDKLHEYRQLMLDRNFGAVDARTARMQQGDSNSNYPNNGNGGSNQSSDYLFGSNSNNSSQGQQQQQSNQQQMASGAYNAFKSATPEQRQQAAGAAQNIYNRSTPEQRQQAFNAVSSAAADDVFV